MWGHSPIKIVHLSTTTQFSNCSHPHGNFSPCISRAAARARQKKLAQAPFVPQPSPCHQSSPVTSNFLFPALVLQLFSTSTSLASITLSSYLISRIPDPVSKQDTPQTLRLTLHLLRLTESKVLFIIIKWNHRLQFLSIGARGEGIDHEGHIIAGMVFVWGNSWEVESLGLEEEGGCS